MKKPDFVISVLLVPADFLLVLLASLSAYYLRFSETVSSLRPVFYEMSFEKYFDISVSVAILAVVIFSLNGFYTMKSKKLVKEVPKVISGVSLVLVVLIMAIFFKRELFSSRFIIIFAWALSIVYLIVIRIIFLLIKNYFLKKGWGLSPVLVLGQASERDLLVSTYQADPTLGFKVVGQVSDLLALQQDQNLMQLVDQKKISTIIEADSAVSKTEALDMLTFCQENHITLEYVANLFQAQSLHLNLSSVAGLPLIEIQATPLAGWRRVYKRIFDFFGALVLLIILSPLFLVLAILIKVTSDGPVFVSLDRVGMRGKIFGMYKFRSMIKDAHILKSDMMAYNERPDGPLFKMKNDPRVTKVGKFIRRWSLDELAQVFNVLTGKMSLVGPRPHEPIEVSKYEKGYKKLLTVKPGITGLAQVSGRASLSFYEEAKLDIFYIENWSLMLDLIILLKTFKVVIKRDAAY